MNGADIDGGNAKVARETTGGFGAGVTRWMVMVVVMELDALRALGCWGAGVLGCWGAGALGLSGSRALG
ncbi:hypothetical protein, partial [Burkholderia contaminans]|uniref:hypothetical protein n=3 Tax=Burkholderia TaxID=32008 RepID=UPI001C958574